jgi:Ca2+-binding EF-hand superfamily protein
MSTNSISGVNATMPTYMSGASSKIPPQQKMANLFQRIDTNNSGSITRAQFTNFFQNANKPVAFQNMGADAIFSKISQNGANSNGANGNSVSQQDFVKGMTNLIEQMRNQAANGVTAQSPAQTTSASLSSFDTILGKHINTYG